MALLGPALVFSPPVLSASPVGVQVERSTLGIRLSTSGALLSTVLAEVGKLAGLSVEGLEHVSGPVTADFDLPVDLTLRRLLRNYNFILIARVLAKRNSMSWARQDRIRGPQRKTARLRCRRSCRC
ncbi:MAG TPA: hypothetical protein VGC99_17930 [Candidatus Tectomicrobia bacterium]